VLAYLIPPQQRSTGYGIFGVTFGLAWFLGGALIGSLYDVSIAFSAITGVVLQLMAIPFIRKVPLKV
jgi:hypothetical protein